MSMKASARLFLLTVVGLLSLGYGIWAVADKLAFSRQARPVSGQVVEKWKERSGGIRRWTEFHVSYTYRVDGEAYSGSYDMLERADWTGLSQGGPIRVEYLPRSPQISRPVTRDVVHLRILGVFMMGLTLLYLAVHGAIAPHRLEA